MTKQHPLSNEPLPDGARSDLPALASSIYAGAKLPLVSFIVVNHNYGRYLRQCVNSIFAQTYPFIECIVVDNASTDESRQEINDLISQYPHLTVIFEPINTGQSAACLKGYHASQGHFIVFVDADDYYSNTFVEAHLSVHLSSSRNPVGFSSSDMWQVSDGVLLGSYLNISEQSEQRCREVRLSSQPSLSNVFRETADRIEVEKLPIRLIDPKITDWVWAPTSGTMYRRQVLALFIDCKNLPLLRCATDAFFNYAINALTGSILIEKPLGVYRIHGKNLFTQSVIIRNLRSFQDGADKSPLAAKYALLHVVANFSRFADVLMDNGTLNTALTTYSRKAAERRLGTIWRATRVIRNKLMQMYWKIMILGV